MISLKSQKESLVIKIHLQLALALTTVWTGQALANALWPLPGQPIVVMNTLSTLQFYGPVTPGFHHGLDLAAAAGTDVVAPAGGRVETGYYYRQETDYTYEIAIITPEGHRWEFHHIDPDSIPAEVERLAEQGREITAGTLIGQIYDASEIGIEPHLHINVIDGEGDYLNPLIRLPDIGDDVAPTIADTWWAKRGVDGYVEIEDPGPGNYTLVIDAFDTAPGNFARQSLYMMQVSYGDESIYDFKFDRLPKTSFLEGVDEVFFLDELTGLDGNIIRSETADTRRFLYGVEITLPEGDIPRLQILAEDFSGNTIRIEVGDPSRSADR